MKGDRETADEETGDMKKGHKARQDIDLLSAIETFYLFMSSGSIFLFLLRGRVDMGLFYLRVVLACSGFGLAAFPSRQPVFVRRAAPVRWCGSSRFARMHFVGPLGFGGAGL